MCCRGYRFATGAAFLQTCHVPPLDGERLTCGRCFLCSWSVRAYRRQALFQSQRALDRAAYGTTVTCCAIACQVVMYLTVLASYHTNAAFAYPRVSPSILLQHMRLQLVDVMQNCLHGVSFDTLGGQRNATTSCSVTHHVTVRRMSLSCASSLSVTGEMQRVL